MSSKNSTELGLPTLVILLVIALALSVAAHSNDAELRKKCEDAGGWFVHIGKGLMHECLGRAEP